MILLLVSLATLVTCATSVADEISSAKDLTATIALNGLPCGQVTQVKRNAESDYLATCQDGHRYHVFVSPQGRVVVQKQ